MLFELNNMAAAKKLRFCEKLRTNLIDGLKSRLGFIESKPLYVHAAILTPKYGLKWLTPSERRAFDKESIIQAIETFLVKKPILATKRVNDDKAEEGEPNKKKMKLFNYMNIYSDLCSSSESDSLTILKQLEDYLTIVNKTSYIDTKKLIDFLL